MYGMPCTHSRSGRRRALHWPLCVEQTHGRSEDGTVVICYNVLHCSQKAAPALVLECYGYLRPSTGTLAPM
jgi:hypothetical protein